MKSWGTIKEELKEKQRSKVVFSSGFRRQLIEDGWCRLRRDDEVVEGDVYGTADGLVKL